MFIDICPFVFLGVLERPTSASEGLAEVAVATEEACAPLCRVGARLCWFCLESRNPHGTTRAEGQSTRMWRGVSSIVRERNGEPRDLPRENGL